MKLIQKVAAGLGESNGQGQAETPIISFQPGVLGMSQVFSQSSIEAQTVRHGF